MAKRSSSSPILSERGRAIVREKMKTGRYGSPRDVLDDSLELLEERDELRLRDLRRAIQEGLKSGKATPFDTVQLKARVHRKLAAGSRRKGR